MRVGVIAGIIALVHLSQVSPGRANTPPGVTMELCSDVDIDDVQEAIAVEYQDEDNARTMITVDCEGSIARVRVIGPSHPRGRIVDVDLTGVDVVARPRTIALLAAELWTAPEAKALEPEPGVAAPMVEETREAPARIGPGFRNRLSMGAGFTRARRGIVAGRRDGRVSATGEFSAIALHADWPMLPRLGVFLNYVQSADENLNGTDDLRSPVRWTRNEMGFYVPLWKKRFRLDVRLSAGEDKFVVRGPMAFNSTSNVLPRYFYSALGVELAYILDKKFLIRGWGTTLNVDNHDLDYQEPRGYRWGGELGYEVNSHLRLDAKVELWSVGQRIADQARSYSDVMSSIQLGVQYLY